jgi:hypothetical protein
MYWGQRVSLALGGTRVHELVPRLRRRQRLNDSSIGSVAKGIFDVAVHAHGSCPLGFPLPRLRQLLMSAYSIKTRFPIRNPGQESEGSPDGETIKRALRAT